MGPRRRRPIRRTASDENGTIAGYAWDLDNDVQFDEASADVATRTFPRKGSYPVAVRMTDNDGASTVARATVVVVAGKRR